MNTPTHIACGACIAHIIAHASRDACVTRSKTAFIAIGVFAASVLSHLALDLLPHYAWIVYLDWFKTMPYHWLIREAVFGLAIALPALMIAGKARPFIVVGMVGGMYPDLEKVLCVDHGLTQPFILFDWHSRYLSNRTAGLPKPLLVIMECCIIAACLFTMWQLNRRASNQNLQGTSRSLGP